MMRLPEPSETALLPGNLYHFHHLGEALRHHILWISDRGVNTVFYASSAFEEIWGRTRAELYRQPSLYLDAIVPSDRDAVRETFQNLSSEAELTYRIHRPDGSLRWIHTNIFLLIRPDASELLAGVSEDVTERQRREEAKREEERRDAIVEVFNGLAHESRNTMQRSQACIELLLLRLAGQPDLVVLLQRLQKAQERQLQLYEEVRMYAAPLNLKRRKILIDACIAEAWRGLATRYGNREVRIERLDERTGQSLTLVNVSAEGENASGPQPTASADSPIPTAWGDPLRLMQLFRQLFTNSLIAVTGALNIAIIIRENQTASVSSVDIIIRDNGPGISPADAASIFKPFFTTRTEGVGLGLPTARRIAEAHGGSITLLPPDGNGAAFCLTLPTVMNN